jgi:hypothetical protein
MDSVVITGHEHIIITQLPLLRILGSSNTTSPQKFRVDIPFADIIIPSDATFGQSIYTWSRWRRKRQQRSSQTPIPTALFSSLHISQKAAAKMVLTLYGNPQSTCTKRVATVFQEKQVPFKFVSIDFAKGEHKAPEFVAKQPFGQVPYLVRISVLFTRSE